MDKLPDIHFGTVGSTVASDTADDVDPDDALLPTTPEDVVALLGFDPLELED